MIFVMMPQAFYFHILFTAFQSPSSFRNPTLEAVKDFFDHVGHQTPLVEISIFSLNNVTVRITKNYEQPPRTSENSDFQSHFFTV